MKNNEKVGIFGGSFSPPHIGHIRAARAFVESEQLDRLLVIPVFLPPHKSADGVVSPEHRLNMCRLAFGDIEGADVEDCEIKRGGNSYTVDTLEYLTRHNRKLVMLCGTDMFLTLDKWYNFRRIFELTKIAFIRRENDPACEALLREKTEEYCRLYSAEISEVVATATEISSTDIRGAIKLGEAEGKFLTPEVNAYIKEHKLYI